jgi:hypothetical protein
MKHTYDRFQTSLFQPIRAWRYPLPVEDKKQTHIRAPFTTLNVDEKLVCLSTFDNEPDILEEICELMNTRNARITE